ncbi:hypothetical protein [Streptomyces rhizosphaericus]|uniref:Uncharacterized protein n=1 Tax=Streptomyces rhizosphaericus TaxID=114699 RepID=A0A6G4ANM2_9ACTN|nr:hypothetical protein [Streptomyces rhizosphaericus]NEW74993.1 hypothetical protein [Streptomyces rhizosphaericus]
MDIVDLLLLLVAGGVLYALLRPFVIYPCQLNKWRCAVSAEHRELREALRSSRQKLKEVRRKSSEDVAAIDRRIAEIDSSCSERAQALEQKRQNLLRPGRGARVEDADGGGKLELYEHMLVFTGEASEDRQALEVRLAGLTIRHDSGNGQFYIVATWPTGPDGPGGQRRAIYPLAEEPTALMMFDAIYSAIERENEFRRDREHEAAKIAAEVERIQADAAEHKMQAQRDRTELIETQRADNAQVRLTSRRRALTGRRKPVVDRRICGGNHKELLNGRGRA